MKEALKFLNKPLTIRWYLLDSGYTTICPICHQVKENKNYTPKKACSQATPQKAPTTKDYYLQKRYNLCSCEKVRGQGSNPGKPDIFRLSFRNCISCVNNCEDLLYTYFFIPQFKYMRFLYS